MREPPSKTVSGDGGERGKSLKLQAWFHRPETMERYRFSAKMFPHGSQMSTYAIVFF